MKSPSTFYRKNFERQLLEAERDWERQINAELREERLARRTKRKLNQITWAWLFSGLSIVISLATNWQEITEFFESFID